MTRAEGTGYRAEGRGQRATDAEINRAIDDIARELTAGEPDGAFKARVIARIESGESVRRTWRAAWIIAPLAAAAAIAIVVVMVSRPARDSRLMPAAAQTVRLTDPPKATSV